MEPTSVVGVSDVVEIGAGTRFACARRADGQVWCWGQPCDDQPYDRPWDRKCESQPAPRLVEDLPPATELRVGSSAACIRTESGEVRCSCRNLFRLSLPTTPREVVSGSMHSCALMANGEVYCWGWRNALGSGRHDGLLIITLP